MGRTRKGGRKGPSASATKFRVGTKKRGSDGKMWIIRAASNGVHRWVKDSSGRHTKKTKTDKGYPEKKDGINYKGLWYPPPKSVSKMSRDEVMRHLRHFRKVWQKMTSRHMDLDEDRLKAESTEELRGLLTSYFDEGSREIALDYLGYGKGPELLAKKKKEVSAHKAAKTRRRKRIQRKHQGGDGTSRGKKSPRPLGRLTPERLRGEGALDAERGSSEEEKESEDVDDKDELRRKMILGLVGKTRTKLAEIESSGMVKRNIGNYFIRKIKRENPKLFEMLKDTTEGEVAAMNTAQLKDFVKKIYDVLSKKSPLQIISLLRSCQKDSWTCKQEVPDLVKYYSNLWVLQYLSEDEGKLIEEKKVSPEQYPFGKYLWRDWDDREKQAERNDKLRELRGNVIDSYKTYESEHPMEWKEAWINQKSWDSWPTRGAFEEFFKEEDLSKDSLYCGHIIDYKGKPQNCKDEADATTPPPSPPPPPPPAAPAASEPSPPKRRFDTPTAPTVAPPQPPPQPKEEDDGSWMGDGEWGGGRRKKRTRKRKKHL